jgi:cytochrome c oxidase subunit 4
MATAHDLATERAAHVRAVHRLLAFVALVVLATASFFIGTLVHWAWGGVAIALGIAALKAGIVLWFFMDMAEQPFRARAAIAVAVILLLVLVGLTATDVATRLVVPRGPAPPAGQSFFRR